MSKITLKKAELELAELKELLKPIETRINGNGGQKSQLWLFNMKYKIYDLEKKIKDMKANKIRTDELTPEDLAIEKRVEDLEKSIENIVEGGNNHGLR